MPSSLLRPSLFVLSVSEKTSYRQLTQAHLSLENSSVHRKSGSEERRVGRVEAGRKKKRWVGGPHYYVDEKG
jgi:hypothetical protein